MRHFGVGRPSVREALLHLSKMGLVEVGSGERARVTSPTPQFVIDALAGPARHMIAAPGGVQNFQNARLFFETGLARHAALHATEEDLAALAEALEANRQSIGDLDRFQQTDVDFHYVLAVIPRNPIFTAIHAALAEWLLEQRRRTLAPGEDAKAYEAHRAIYEAVAARDPDRAERAMREHLDYVAQALHRRRRRARRERLRDRRRFRAEARRATRDFRRLVDANARASAQQEPGCRRFDVFVPQRRAATGCCSTRSTTTRRRSTRTARPRISPASTARARRWSRASRCCSGDLVCEGTTERRLSPEVARRTKGG